MIVEALHDGGIRQAFMLTGGGAMHLNDALGRHGGIDVVCTLHEQGAAFAADGYARQTGRPALCLVTAGPGGTNAITGVASAWVDSVPMVIVSGQAKRADLVGTTGLRQRGVQEIDIVSMVRGITKSAVTLTDPKRVRVEVDRAVRLATSGRPGPVWLDVPLDVQGAPGDAQARAESGPAAVSPTDLTGSAESVAALLRRARRPLLLIGAGVRLAGAEAGALALAEEAGVPVLSTWPAQGVVGDDHPLYVGRPGGLASRGSNFALQAADLLICLGARLDLTTTGYDPKDFGRNARKVVVEIDPFELAKLEHAIDVAVEGDVAEFIPALRRALGAPAWTDTDGWVDRCGAWRDAYPVVTAEHRRPGPTISTYHLADVLSDSVGAGDVMAFGCSGLGIEIFILALRVHTGQRAIFGNALGPMGAGPPTALGACIGSGGRRTICVDGDGGLQLNIQEMQTIRRLDLPVKLFVLANDGYASIRASQRRWFDRVIGADPASGVTLPPLDAVAAAYGWTYRRLRGDVDLRSQVDAALGLDGPVLVEVPTPADEARQPAQASELLPDGGMRSLPLEDLAPRLDPAELARNVLGPDGTFVDPGRPGAR